jgi:hypothetical protein
MRQAKQKRSDNLAAQAQQMATERADRLVHDLNHKTNNSIERSMNSNREQLKEEALQASILGRQGRAYDQKNSVESKYVTNKPLPRDKIEVDRATVGKRRQQVTINPEYEDSLAPGYRRALKDDAPLRNKNDPEPRFHPQASQRPTPNRPSETRQAQSAIVAHGINHNPIVEARRRKALEQKIRELASQ